MGGTTVGGRSVLDDRQAAAADGPADHGSGSAFGLRREGETQPGIIMSDCYSMQHQCLPPHLRGAGLRFRQGQILGRPLDTRRLY